MPSATGLLRLSLAIAAVFAAGIAALIFASRLIPPDRVRQAVLTEIRSATGLEPAIRGEAAVSLFPSAMVSFSDVTLGDERPTPALSADRLTVRLALLPLLIGRIEPADLTLTRPRLLVAVEPDGRSNWSSLMATLARTLKPRARGAEPVHVVVRIAHDRRHDHRHRGSARNFRRIVRCGAVVRLAVDRAQLRRDRPFHVARRSLRRERERGRSAGGALRRSLRPEAAARRRPFKLAFEGAMSQKPSFKMEGTLAIDGKSLREALRWANRQPLPGSGMGPFALKAQTSFTGGMAIMLGVNIELDGNVAEGVLAVATEPRVTLKGTLAADTLDLSPYVSTFEVLRSNDRDWSRGPFAIDNLANFDLDLRLSSARVNVVNARLGRTGVAVNLRDARLTLAIGEAQAYGGVLKGAFILSKTETGADVKTQLQFTDVDLESCLGELFAIRKLEGKGNLSLSLEASGDSMRHSHARWRVPRNFGPGRARSRGSTSSSCSSGWSSARSRSAATSAAAARRSSGSLPRRRSCKAWRRSRRCGSRAERSASVSADRPRSRRAISICAARPRWFPPRPMPRPCSNCRSWSRGRGTTRSCCPTRRA